MANLCPWSRKKILKFFMGVHPWDNCGVGGGANSWVKADSCTRPPWFLPVCFLHWFVYLSGSYPGYYVPLMVTWWRMPMRMPMRMYVCASGGYRGAMLGLCLSCSPFLLMFVWWWWSRSKARHKANASLVNIINIIGQSLKADFRPYFVA